MLVRATLEFLSTPPVWVATQPLHHAALHETVSIHATRVGGDFWFSIMSRVPFCFYPRHPCGWRRSAPTRWKLLFRVSIHATRVGGDPFPRRHSWPTAGFYPRHPCGWRRSARVPFPPVFWVSIHATRVGGDLEEKVEVANHRMFLSTPPVWVATTEAAGK